MLRRFSTLLLSLSLVFPALSAAQDVASSIELEGNTLKLNGVGIRTKFFFDIYSGALYTQDKVTDFAGVKRNQNHARVSMKIIYSKVTDEQFRDAWQEGFEKNLSADEQKQFAEEIKKFFAAFPTVERDGVIDVDFLSGGTQVSINGKVAVSISNPAFNEALLRIWFGEHPAHEGLMEGMLGKD